MKFNVVEVKKIGRDMLFSLAVRLEKSDEQGEAQSTGQPRLASPYTIQAVLPYSPEFGSMQIGDEYEFKRSPAEVIGEYTDYVGVTASETRKRKI